ncbi:MAG: iron-containing alcohol dehydrogenase, partial [Acidobacteriota bacterium]
MTHPSHPPSADVPAAEGFDLDLGAIRVVFGAGTLDRLGELADALGSRRPLVVTDPGLVAAGHAEHAERSLA